MLSQNKLTSALEVLVACFTANKLTNFLPWNKKKKKKQLEPGLLSQQIIFLH